MLKPEISILGAGFAALTAAQSIRKRSLEAKITIIAPRSQFEYYPSLIWVPTGLRQRKDILHSLDGFFERHDINYKQATVTGLSADGRTVETSDGSVTNDALIIATGGRFIKKMPGIEHALTICEGIDAAEAIFAPQAWYLYPPNLPVLAELKAAGRPFFGLMGLYFDLAPAATLAFTGSNGKSTSSRLAETILRLTDQRIYYAGNERRSVQVLDRLDGMRPEDWLILEVSNRHLKEIAPRPRIGVVTNVLPNHLDEHDGSFEAYAAVKARLLVEQGADDLAVLNADNPATLAMAQTLSSQVFLFSRLGEVPRGAWLDPAGRIKLRRSPRGQVVDAGPAAASRLPGAHNQENILAAALASYLAGASPEQIQRGIGMFRGLRHRCQFVWAAEGVSYFDDLNSTTPRASMAALEALPGPINWIAGGDDKGLDYEDLARLATRRCRRVLLLPGAGSDRLAEAMQRVGAQSSAGLEVLRPANLREAVARSVALAEPGDTVLLSPACPFFFSLHYLTEGDREAGFKSLLRELTLGDSARRARQEEPQ